MKAVRYERCGPAAEVLRVEDVAKPAPGPGEVRVRMTLSGINPTDWKARSGATPRPIDGFQIPHHDGTGIIDAVGEGVDDGRIGQRVWTWLAAASRRVGDCRSVVASCRHARPFRCQTGYPTSSAHAWACRP